jgi:hypothetical protein
MHEDYLDGKLPTFMAKSKFNYLQNKGTWGAKSIDDDKIVAMTAAINELEGQLKLSSQLAVKVEKGNKKKKGQKNKNKKDKSDRVKQKRDEAWKKVPPKDGEKHEKKYDELPTIGASTTWHGPCTHPRSVALARNERKKKR